MKRKYVTIVFEITLPRNYSINVRNLFQISYPFFHGESPSRGLYHNSFNTLYMRIDVILLLMEHKYRNV